MEQGNIHIGSAGVSSALNSNTGTNGGCGLKSTSLVETIVLDHRIELLYKEETLYSTSYKSEPRIYKVVYDLVPGSQRIIDGKYHAAFTVPEEYSFDEVEKDESN